MTDGAAKLGGNKLEATARLLAVGAATTWVGFVAIVSLVLYSDYEYFHRSPLSRANLYTMGALGIGLLASLGVFPLLKAGQRALALTLGTVAAFFAMLGLLVLMFMIGVASQ